MGEYNDAQAVSRPAGGIVVDGVQVADTVQCRHCGKHFVMRHGSGTVRGYCQRCGGLVCGPRCAACVPFEQALDLAEKRGYR